MGGIWNGFWNSMGRKNDGAIVGALIKLLDKNSALVA
jgi:hypothetical protein